MAYPPLVVMQEISESASVANGISPLIGLLRCLECGLPLKLIDLVSESEPRLGPDGTLRCSGCSRDYPVVAGTARVLRREGGKPGEEQRLRQRTVEGFTYEWEHFGDLRKQWRKNFLDYMQPHTAESFRGRLVLDVGAGSGRHSRVAAELGADIVAVDLGASIDVARRNLPGGALTVQADAEDLPFAPNTFDFVMSIGVLHHLSDPERAFHSIARYARPGGYVQVYVYWMPSRPLHRRLLGYVARARRVTVRLPYPVLHAAAYPIAGALFAIFVLPYRLLRRQRWTRGLADAFPLKTYADYPFSVCVNDQFDRFSAPIEHRYLLPEIERWFRSAGLEDVTIVPNHGWVASGRVPGDV